MIEMETVSEMMDTTPILTAHCHIKLNCVSKSIVTRCPRSRNIRMVKLQKYCRDPTLLGNITANMYLHEEVQSIGKHARASQGVSDDETLTRGPVMVEC
jgi:hypothetical protein